MAKNGVDEAPRAYVIRRKQLREAEMLTAEEVYRFARTRLASYKAIDGGVCFVEEIPRTASGKIQRAKLARMDEYRRSITAVLLSANVSLDQKDKISEIKDAAMGGVDKATARHDTELLPRRSPRLSEQRAISSSSSSEDLPLGKVNMRPTRKSTIDSGSSDHNDPTSPVNDMKVKKKRSKRTKVKKIVDAMQAAAA